MEVTGKRQFTHTDAYNMHTLHTCTCACRSVQIEVTCVDNHDIYKGGLN